MMLHAAMLWPDASEKSLWPLAMQHAVHLHNHTPSSSTKLAPVEIWTQSHHSLKTVRNAHPWVCPVHVLQPCLQDGQKNPNWYPRSRRGQYLGYSPLHASSVALVRNLITETLSPQFHMVFDDWFETINCPTETKPKEFYEK